VRQVLGDFTISNLLELEGGKVVVGTDENGVPNERSASILGQHLGQIAEKPFTGVGDRAAPSAATSRSRCIDPRVQDAGDRAAPRHERVKEPRRPRNQELHRPREQELRHPREQSSASCWFSLFACPSNCSRFQTLPCRSVSSYPLFPLWSFVSAFLLPDLQKFSVPIEVLHPAMVSLRHDMRSGRGRR